MIIKGFSSLKEVIESAYRDAQYQEEIPLEDLIYWAYEGLELMGHTVQYIPKVTGSEADPNLDITNYRAPLPCDFHKLRQVAVNGYPARYAGNTFHHLLDGDCCGVGTNSQDSDIFRDAEGNIYTPQAGLSNNSYVYDSVTFDINNDYITLSVQEGEVCISYWAIPTDKEGFPMIPNDMNFKTAIKTYLMKKIAYIDWAKDPSNRGKMIMHEHLEKECNWYFGKAAAQAKIPDLEQMESMKNQWIRLVPHINHHDTFFKHLGAKHHKRLK